MTSTCDCLPWRESLRAVHVHGRATGSPGCCRSLTGSFLLLTPLDSMAVPIADSDDPATRMTRPPWRSTAESPASRASMECEETLPADGTCDTGRIEDVLKEATSWATLSVRGESAVPGSTPSLVTAGPTLSEGADWVL